MILTAIRFEVTPVSLPPQTMTAHLWPRLTPSAGSPCMYINPETKDPRPLSIAFERLLPPPLPPACQLVREVHHYQHPLEGLELCVRGGERLLSGR